MIQRIDMYTCICDRCGKRHENDNLGYMAWVDGSQAFEDAEEAGWTEIDGKHYCPDCYEYDEELDDYRPKVNDGKIQNTEG